MGMRLDKPSRGYVTMAKKLSRLKCSYTASQVSLREHPTRTQHGQAQRPIMPVKSQKNRRLHNE